MAHNTLACLHVHHWLAYSGLIIKMLLHHRQRRLVVESTMRSLTIGPLHLCWLASVNWICPFCPFVTTDIICLRLFSQLCLHCLRIQHMNMPATLKWGYFKITIESSSTNILLKCFGLSVQIQHHRHCILPWPTHNNLAFWCPLCQWISHQHSCI